MAALVVDLVARAQESAGHVDGVVLPEAALDTAAANRLARGLLGRGVRWLVTGVMDRVNDGDASVSSWAQFCRFEATACR